MEGLVRALGPAAKKLNSDYAATYSYYYIPPTNAMVEIDGVRKLMRKPDWTVEQHLRERNGLPRAG
jgi:hypothetical protein